MKKLQTNDVYNFLLFALTVIKDDPAYSVLSELMYILDKESVLKLFEYYGGQTITIPKISDLEEMVYALNIYQQVQFHNEDFDRLLVKLPTGVSKSSVTEIYKKLDTVMKNYNFKR